MADPVTSRTNVRMRRPRSDSARRPIVGCARAPASRQGPSETRLAATEEGAEKTVRGGHFRTSPPPPVTDMKTRTKLRLLIGIAGVALTTAALMAVPALG